MDLNSAGGGGRLWRVIIKEPVRMIVQRSVESWFITRERKLVISSERGGGGRQRRQEQRGQEERLLKTGSERSSLELRFSLHLFIFIKTKSTIHSSSALMSLSLCVKQANVHSVSHSNFLSSKARRIFEEHPELFCVVKVIVNEGQGLSNSKVTSKHH